MLLRFSKDKFQNMEYLLKWFDNKKVLLCERKRHTARRVASTCCAGLVGGGRRGTPWRGVPPAGGTPWWGVPPARGSTPAGGVPLLGYPPVSWMGYPPPGKGYPPSAGWGTPHLWRVPPCLGRGYPPPPLAGWGTPLSRPGKGVPPPVSQMGYPPLDVNWQTNWKYCLSPSFGCGR